MTRAFSSEVDPSPRHGRACPGHPRLSSGDTKKTWMPGTSPGMTNSDAPHGTQRLYPGGNRSNARAKPRGDRGTAARKPRYRLAQCAASVCLLLLASAAADARSLETIIERGTLTLCAHPNALPFASKTGPVSGFQTELGEKIAQQLGVKLTREWVATAIHYRRADCDLVLDAIIRKDVPPEGGIKLSRPYRRGGVVLAVRADFAGLIAGQSRPRSAGRRAGQLAGLDDAEQGRHRHVPVRVRGGYRCGAGQSRDRGGRRHTGDGRLVQPAACRQAVAPDSGVRERSGFELEHRGLAVSPRRQAASRVSMRRSRRCWRMARSRRSTPVTASSCGLRSEALTPSNRSRRQSLGRLTFHVSFADDSAISVSVRSTPSTPFTISVRNRSRSPVVFTRTFSR